jgi:hypothetical protein
MSNVSYTRKSIPYWYNYNITIVHLYRCHDAVLLSLFSLMICAIQYTTLCFYQSSTFYFHCCYRITSSTITIPSTTNRHPIVDILCLISVEIVFNRLSNVRLLLGIVTRPRADASLWLY